MPTPCVQRLTRIPPIGINMELPRNCRLVRTEPQRLKPSWAELSEEEYNDGEGIVSLMAGVADFPPDALWLVLEYPEGTDAQALVHRLQTLGRHYLWDVVLGSKPKVLLIRDKPRELPYERLWIRGAKPLVRGCHNDPDYTPFQQALYHLMIAGFWSMLGPEREANMRLEGMQQAVRKEDDGVLWGSWSDFVDPEKEM